MNKLFEKFKNNKLLLLIFILGVILILIPSPKKETEKETDFSAYEKTLTKDLTAFLEKIDGAGRVEVMITFSDSGRIVPVTDKTATSQGVNEKNVMAGGELSVYRKEYPKVSGVAVASSGADSERVRENIISALQSLLGVPIHKIKVYKLKG